MIAHTERPDHTERSDVPDLTGKIALVAGATRGAGRAIAVELGRAGAVVYCTGRSTLRCPSDYGRSETVEETAEIINDAGGTAHVSVTDHLDAGAVRALVVLTTDVVSPVGMAG